MQLAFSVFNELNSAEMSDQRATGRKISVKNARKKGNKEHPETMNIWLLKN